jgi:hypothetical protein
MIALAFDESGNVAVPAPRELEKIDTHTYVVAFTDGKVADGRHYYAYIAVKPSLYQEFYNNTLEKKPMVLSNYGTVIIADFLQNPPEEIVEFMRNEFGFEDNLEDSLKQQVSAQRTAYIKENEIKRTQDIVSMMKQSNNKNNLDQQLSEPADKQPQPTADNRDQRLDDIIAMMKKNQ